MACIILQLLKKDAKTFLMMADQYNVAKLKEAVRNLEPVFLASEGVKAKGGRRSKWSNWSKWYKWSK